MISSSKELQVSYGSYRIYQCEEFWKLFSNYIFCWFTASDVEVGEYDFFNVQKIYESLRCMTWKGEKFLVIINYQQFFSFWFQYECKNEDCSCSYTCRNYTMSKDLNTWKNWVHGSGSDSQSPFLAYNKSDL